jgi:hypothetical protein
MRMAGRFSRRLRAFAKARGIPAIECKRGERKHAVGEEYLARHTGEPGLFLILMGKAQAPVWEATGQHPLSGKSPGRTLTTTRSISGIRSADISRSKSLAIRPFRRRSS